MERKFVEKFKDWLMSVCALLLFFSSVYGLMIGLSFETQTVLVPWWAGLILGASGLYVALKLIKTINNNDSST